jgi:hypothetical protein
MTYHLFVGFGSIFVVRVRWRMGVVVIIDCHGCCGWCYGGLWLFLNSCLCFVVVVGQCLVGLSLVFQ